MGSNDAVRREVSREPEVDVLVGARGFEPPTSSSRTMRATKLRHAPTVGAPEGRGMIAHVPWPVAQVEVVLQDEDGALVDRQLSVGPFDAIPLDHRRRRSAPAWSTTWSSETSARRRTLRDSS